MTRYWFSRLHFPVSYTGILREVVWTGVWGVQIGGWFIGVIRGAENADFQREHR